MSAANQVQRKRTALERARMTVQLADLAVQKVGRAIKAAPPAVRLTAGRELDALAEALATMAKAQAELLAVIDGGVLGGVYGQ